MTQKLIELDRGNILQSGLNPGVIPKAAPLWVDGENIFFQAGGFRKSDGWEKQITAGSAVTGLGQARLQAENRLYYGTADELYFWNETFSTKIGEGYLGNQWVLAPYGNFLIATNNVDRVQIWKNIGLAAPLGGAPFQRAKVLLIANESVVAANLDEGGRLVRISSTAAPEDWIPNENNTAAVFNLLELDSEIVGATYLGESLAFYSESSLVVLVPTADQFRYDPQPALKGIGLVGRNCVCSVGRQNYGLSKQGVFATDGVGFQYIDAEIDRHPMRDWMQDNLDYASGELFSCWHDDRNTQVIWNVRLLDGTWIGIAFNYTTKAWSKISHKRSAAIPRDVFDYPVVAEDTFIHFYGKGIDADDAALPFELISKPIDFDDELLEKVIDIVRLRKVSQGDVTFALGFQEDLADPVDWVSAPIESVNYFDRQATYITMRFTGVGLNCFLECLGIVFEGEPGGYNG